jgi:hypothetical protein
VPEYLTFLGYFCSLVKNKNILKSFQEKEEKVFPIIPEF